MSQSVVHHSTHGIGVVGLLGVLFVALKLCGIIQWSWWLVTLPFWGGAALVVALLVVLALVIGIVAGVIALASLCRRKPRRN